MEKRGGISNPFKNRFIIAITTLIGTVVGAGILAIPYVVSQTGFLYGLFLLLLIGISFIFLHLFVGEIVLRTKGQFQLSGYAEKYLGKRGKIFMTLSMLMGIYGALTAYLIGEGASLQKIFGFPSFLTKLFSLFPVTVGSFIQSHFYSLLFFIIGVIIIYKGISTLGKVELLLIPALVFVIILIGVFSYNTISIENLQGFNPLYLFLPYGVIIFAYSGSSTVPVLQEILEREKKKLKKAIIIACIIPIILYILFTLIIVGIIGADNFSLLQPNERIATIALSIYSSPVLSLFANILAILAMFTSFLTLGRALVELFEYDYQFSKTPAFFLTFILPLLLVLLDFTTFITIIDVTGAIAGGIGGILIILMYWKAKQKSERKPEYSLQNYKLMSAVLVLLFAVGIFHQIWTTFF